MRPEDVPPGSGRDEEFRLPRSRLRSDGRQLLTLLWQRVPGSSSLRSVRDEATYRFTSLARGFNHDVPVPADTLSTFPLPSLAPAEGLVVTPIRMTGTTHRGEVRGRNEDAWSCDEDLRLAVVADGMGGHPAGDVASRLAVQSVIDFFSADTGRSGEDPGERMAESVRRANQRILDRGREQPEQAGMGTTLTVLRIDEEAGRFRIGHVGDSRAYLYRDGRLEPLTRDHTPLQERVDAGLMSREEARVHPMGHVLSQALGTESRVSPQVVEGELRSGDLFLLCTDGLTAVLSEDRIEEILASASTGGATDPDDPEPGDRLPVLGKTLVNAVLDGGAPDNVTVALAAVGRRS